MADYSVTIKVSGSSASHVHHHLQTAFGTAVARQAVITTWGSHNLYYDHCRELGHFGLRPLDRRRHREQVSRTWHPSDSGTSERGKSPH